MDNGCGMKNWGHLDVKSLGKGRYLLQGRVHSRKIQENFGLPQKVRRRFGSEKEAYEKLAAITAFAEAVTARRRPVDTWLADEQIRAAEWAFEEIQGRDFRSVVRAGLRALPNKSDSLLLDLLRDAEKELDANGRSYRTIQSFSNRLKSFFSETGILEVDQFNRDTILEYFAGFAEGPVSRRNARTALHQFGNFLENRGLLPENPVRKVPVPKIPWSPPRIATPDEVARLFEAAAGYRPRGEKKGVALGFLVFGFFTGARPESELAHLDQSCVFEKDCELHILRSKTTRGSQRVIQIHPVLLEWIQFLKKEKLSYFRMSKRWRKEVCKIAKVKWSPDLMRHSFATYWLPINSYDVFGLSLQMGNSPTVVKRNYWNLAKGNKTAAKEFWDLGPKKVEKT